MGSIQTSPDVFINGTPICIYVVFELPTIRLISSAFWSIFETYVLRFSTLPLMTALSSLVIWRSISSLVSEILDDIFWIKLFSNIEFPSKDDPSITIQFDPSHCLQTFGIWLVSIHINSFSGLSGSASWINISFSTASAIRAVTDEFADKSTLSATADSIVSVSTRLVPCVCSVSTTKLK